MTVTASADTVTLPTNVNVPVEANSANQDQLVTNLSPVPDPVEVEHNPALEVDLVFVDSADADNRSSCERNPFDSPSPDVFHSLPSPCDETYSCDECDECQRQSTAAPPVSDSDSAERSAAMAAAAPSIVIENHRSCGMDAESCGGGDQSGSDSQSESEGPRSHHSRLLRLLSNDQDVADTLPGADLGGESYDPCRSTVLADEMMAFLPPSLPGVRLRIKSKRAKDRIPSRVFRFLQQEFDSSPSEDVSSMSSFDYNAFYRPSSQLHSLSLTPESRSSAASAASAASDHDFDFNQFKRQFSDFN